MLDNSARVAKVRNKKKENGVSDSVNIQVVEEVDDDDLKGTRMSNDVSWLFKIIIGATMTVLSSLVVFGIISTIDTNKKLGILTEKVTTLTTQIDRLTKITEDHMDPNNAHPESKRRLDLQELRIKDQDRRIEKLEQKLNH